MYNTVIFDVDGTLLNSSTGILASVEKAILHFNLKKLDESQILRFVGPPVQNSYKMFFEDDEIKAQEFANYFRKIYAAGDVYLSTVYPNIYDLVEYLKNNGFKLGVATYKRQDYAKNLMKHFKFDKYFDSIYGADNENKLKKIDILKNCINSLSSDLSKVLFIGDSYHDAQAALELGVDFIAVTYGFGFKNEADIKIYNPVFIAETPMDIINWLKQCANERRTVANGII